MKIICLDAFKPEYLQYAPYLKSLSKEHIYGELETVFAYTGISGSFFTGLYPDKHNIFIMFKKTRKHFELPLPNFLLDYWKIFIRLIQNKRFFNKYYQIPKKALPYFKSSLDKIWYQEGCLKVKTIFDYLKENNISFSYLDYPHFFDSKNNVEKLYFKGSDKMTLSKMKKLKSQVQFIFLHELDSISHKCGIHSKEVIRHIKFLDRELSKLDEDVIFWSDHGFLNVKARINIEKHLEKLNLEYGKDYIYFLSSTMALFWFNNKQAEEKVRKVLSDIKGGKVLTDLELKELKVPNQQDLVFLCDTGYVIFPDFFNKKIPKAMHGYDPKIMGQKGFYLMSIKGKEKNARLIDLMPTILKN